MTRFMIRVSLLVLVLMSAAASLVAAPQLRLRMPGSQPAENPFSRAIWVASGTNGPANLEFHAYNIGDGSLDVQASSDGGIAWLTPQVDAALPCAFNHEYYCRRVRVLLATGALADGVYGCDVIVTATAAVDSPQTVPVKIYVGGNVPADIHFYVQPTSGASDFILFQTPGLQGQSPTGVVAAGSFLSVSASHNGSFRQVYDHRVTGTYQSGGTGDQEGSVTVSGSVFAADNGIVPVTLHVTNDPIGQLSSSQATISAAEGLAPPDFRVTVSNRGSGSLATSDANIATDDGGSWLSAISATGNGAYDIRATVDGLAAGTYEGTVTINSNAANSPHQVRVALQLAPRTGPLSFYRGTINGANFEATRPLAPGMIASAFGSQLSDAIAVAGTLPLPTDLGGTKVMVDGIEAPLYFVSYGQVNFQVPYGVGSGQRTLQIMRDGQMGNPISIQVDNFSAGIFRSGIGEYGAIQNASQGNKFPIPTALGQQFGLDTVPARPGDVLVIYATGLGPLDRSVESGAGAPSSPLARAVVIPRVNFGPSFSGPLADPFFVGLAPGFVGLFQVNVVIPPNMATNANTPVTLDIPNTASSNRVEIAIQ
jgi:uncharacterized protein (TIGR03437 family)